MTVATLEALYLHDPSWLWLGAAGLFVALNLASGSAILMLPALAAVMVAAVGLAGVRLGLGVEAGLFAAVSAMLFGLVRATAARPQRSPARAKPARTKPERSAVARDSAPPASGLQNQSARLVGRIGRTSSVFMNGVGRVWIDGAEWAAEIDAGEDDLAQGIPVRVTKVIGGVRLQVHGLDA